jgi:predicted restriction endonuclease
MADKTTKWTDDQLKLAFYLYCQLPFGKLHSKNSQIIHLAKLINRTPSAVAMKLVNFASLDPAIKNTGRKGLGNASSADRNIWNMFHDNWEQLTEECASLLKQYTADTTDIIGTKDIDNDYADYKGSTKMASVSIRIGQAFFRKTVLVNYQNCCCMSGVSLPQLLIASHIIPWAAAKENRLNPSNGLCLSAIHDKAFDKGLITVTPDHLILVSSRLKSDNCEQIKLLTDLNGKKIKLPEKFVPNRDFLQWHNEHIFQH